jgi:predicted acyltransferase (DUF342 family)
VGGATMIASTLGVKGDTVIDGSLSTTSNVAIGNSLSVASNVWIGSNLTVLGDLTQISQAYISSSLIVNSNITAYGSLSTLSSAYFGKNVSVAGDLVVAGNIFFDTNLFTLKNLSVTNSLYVGSNISTVGTVAFASTLNVLGDVTAMGNLSVMSNTMIRGNLSTVGTLDTGGTANFLSNVVVNGELRMNSNVLAVGVLTTQSNVVVGGSLLTSGQATFSSNISSIGAVAIGSNLWVQSNTALGGKVSVIQDAMFLSSVNILGTLNLLSNISVGGVLTAANVQFPGNAVLNTLTVSCNVGFSLSTMGSTLQFGLLSTVGGINMGGRFSTTNVIATGSTLYAANILATNNISSLGSLGVGGDASFNGSLTTNGTQVTINNNITNTLTTRVNTNLNVGGVLTVNGNTSLGGDLSIAGNTTFTDFTITDELKIFTLSSVNGPSFFYSTVYFAAGVSVMSTMTVSTLNVTGGFQVQSLQLPGVVDVGGLITTGLSNTGLTNISYNLPAAQFFVSGYGTTGPTQVRYSADGLTWTSLIGTYLNSTDVSVRSAIYQYPNWYFVASNTASNSIQIISTSNLAGGAFVASNIATGVSPTIGAFATNGFVWLIASDTGGTGGLYRSYSSPLNTFSPVTLSPAYNFYGFAWNGSLWVAVGYQSGNLTNSIFYSTSPDASSWIVGTNPFVFSVAGNLTNRGACVVWNGQMFVAGAVFSQNLVKIKYSYDGINWSNSTFTTTSNVVSLAWSGYRFVALVTGTGAASLMYSDDGIGWSNTLGTNTFTYSGFTSNASVTWSGNRFVAVASNTNTSNIRQSIDGITWTTPNVTSPVGFYTAAYSQNFYPDVQIANLNIYSDQQFQTTSTNSILLYSNAIGLNDTMIVQKNSNVLVPGTGRLGIGTQFPNYSLHIHSPLLNTERRIQLTDATTGRGVSDGFQIYKDTGLNAWINNFETGSLILGTNGLQRFTIDANGNITATGSINASGNITTSGTVTSGAINASGNITTSGTMTAGSISATGNITTSGTVTSGTINASGNITTSGRISATAFGSQNGYEFKSSIDSTIFSIGNTGIVTLYSSITPTAGTMFVNGGIEAFSLRAGLSVIAGDIVASGKVNINGSGTKANPSLFWANDTGSGFYRPSDNVIGVSINGAQVASWTSGGVYIYNNGTNNRPSLSWPNANDEDVDSGFYHPGDGAIAVSINGTERARWTTGGQEVVGTLSVAGNITATGNVTAYSDKRIKTNILPLTQALSTVNAMRGVYFNLNADPGGKRNVGVIAQEIEEVFPEVVHTDSSEDQKKSVAYGNITAILIEAVKELTAKVESLEKKLSAV